MTIMKQTSFHQDSGDISGFELHLIRSNSTATATETAVYREWVQQARDWQKTAQSALEKAYKKAIESAPTVDFTDCINERHKQIEALNDEYAFNLEALSSDLGTELDQLRHQLKISNQIAASSVEAVLATSTQYKDLAALLAVVDDLGGNTELIQTKLHDSVLPGYAEKVQEIEAVIIELQTEQNHFNQSLTFQLTEQLK